MVCPKCGQDNPAEARFCGKCAAALMPAPPVNLPPPAAEQTVTSGLKIGIIIGTVLIPLLGIIMGLVYMNDPNPQKKAAGRVWLYTAIGILALYCLCGVIAVLMESGGSF